MIQIKRTYEPAAAADGQRILVERLWPRGMKKEALVADAWMKDVAPTTELRKWFGHEEDRWDEFRKRYRKELSSNPSSWAPLLEAARKGKLTLLYSAHDTVHNGAVVLREFLIERQARAPSSSKAQKQTPADGSTGSRSAHRPDARRR